MGAERAEKTDKAKLLYVESFLLPTKDPRPLLAQP